MKDVKKKKAVKCLPGEGEQCIIIEILSTSSPPKNKNNVKSQIAFQKTMLTVFVRLSKFLFLLYNNSIIIIDLTVSEYKHKTFQIMK